MSHLPVVLLHGLGRTHRSMSGLGRFLALRGHRVWKHDYPSRHGSLQELADQQVEAIRKAVGDGPVSAVTHSLGGILVRQIADRLPWHRVVLLAPPNQGSRVARALVGHPLFAWFFGKSGIEVANPREWPLPPSPFAVIAGNLGPSVGNPPSWLVHAFGILPEGEPNDGLLTVEETRLDGATAFATVEASHTWIMDHPRARALTADFLERESFDPPPAAG